MSSARHDLVLLVRLQSIYDRIAVAIRERQTAPPEVQELQQANRDRQAELEKSEAQVRGYQDELTKVRKKEEEWKLELEHFQRQKGTVTNEREFTAVISEIDYASKALAEAAARRRELEDSIAALNADIEERRQARPEEEAAHRDVVEAWETRKAELKAAVHELVLEAQTVEADVTPKHRARFLRLLESKKGTAMAAVVEGSCSLCHFALRPHLQQRVRRAEEIIVCEHCQRILYLERMLNDEPSPGPEPS
ncbi:MAG TPA: C4-type zinc ribbon domain-containing protein [Candidatus Sulfomarinibacteraceae bacterium]|nr:C4-type zinc ribbon domain-containing protein [Candidatus Sulfomarinibacteraceae bacterium]